MILLNGQIVNFTKFSGGEVQIKSQDVESLIKISETVKVSMRYESFDDFMLLSQLKEILDKHNLLAVLDMPYLPFARYDRAFNDFDANTLSIFVDLLNNLRFNEIILYDVHNLEAIKHLRNVTHRDFMHNFEMSYFYDSYDGVKEVIIISVDKGNKIKLDEYFTIGLELDKKRDENGKIIGHQIVKENYNFKDDREYNFFIIDDICDGGQTFLSANKILKERFPNCKVHLYTTYGIYSKGLEELCKNLDSVGCYFNFKKKETYPINFVYDDLFYVEK